MIDFVNEPWGHLVHEEKEYLEMLKKADTPQDIINDFIYGINKKPKKYYYDLFKTVVKNGMFEKICSYSWSGVASDDNLSHNNYIELCKTYSKEDLLFRGMNILIKKKGTTLKLQDETALKRHSGIASSLKSLFLDKLVIS